MKKIKLVLSGSGTLYPIHAGAVCCLLDKGYHIEEICGVSGGSIVASAIASGANSETLRYLILNTIPKLDYNIFSLAKFGIIKGDKIKKQLSQYFVNTFKDVLIPLTIIGSNITDRKKEIFSTFSTPDENIADIVRISISFPGLFEYVLKDGKIFIDGGLFNNYPLDIFSNCDNVLGIRIIPKSNPKINNIFDYISTLMEIAVQKSETEDIEDSSNARNIEINCNYSSINTNISKEYIYELFNLGYNHILKEMTTKK